MAFVPFTKDDQPTMAAFNEKLQAIFDFAESKAKIEVGSYVGTGTYGSSNPNTLTFGFEPKLVIIAEALKPGNFIWFNVFALGNEYIDNRGYQYRYIIDGSTASYLLMAKIQNLTLKWYTTGTSATVNQFNVSGTTYYYIAIGRNEV